MIRRVGSADSPLTKLKSIASIETPKTSNLAMVSPDDTRKHHRRNSSMSSATKTLAAMKGYMNSTRLMVLVVLCLQNSMFTTLRRYSQGVLKENYSKVIINQTRKRTAV